MLRSVLRRLAALGPKLDLHPVLPMVRRSGPGKSYHFGGTFAHGVDSDVLGRIGEWRDIHLIDGSVLPSIPSTTFTLSVMANAHRIATAVRDA
jgi:choline dehydrogenase-like flavoprotein